MNRKTNSFARHAPDATVSGRFVRESRCPECGDPVGSALDLSLVDGVAICAFCHSQRDDDPDAWLDALHFDTPLAANDGEGGER